jgi:Rrf2 family protein
VAQCSNIPQQYLSKIIQSLVHRGLVLSQKGIGGGVKLAHEPGKTSLYEVCLAMDDPIIQGRCMLGNTPCSDDRYCPCHSFWQTQRDEVIRFLKETSLERFGSFAEIYCDPFDVEKPCEAAGSPGLIQPNPKPLKRPPP